MKGSSLRSRFGSLVCPLYEVHELDVRGHSSAYCASCGDVVSGAMLEALRQITDLLDALGRHACECGHPEMRLLGDGVLWCPGCGSEVLPISASTIHIESESTSEAYWSGWAEGLFGSTERIVRNEGLARWEDAHDRLDYYRGHRAGRAFRTT